MTPVLQPTSSYESPGSATDGGTVAASKLDFVRAMRNVVSGVAIITTFYESQLWGMTVSAFTTVCAEPPTLMVCVNTRTVLATVLREGSGFGVNVLSQDQEFVVEEPAQPVKGVAHPWLGHSHAFRRSRDIAFCQ